MKAKLKDLIIEAEIYAEPYSVTGQDAVYEKMAEYLDMKGVKVCDKVDTIAERLTEKGYRKVEQGECEYCKTGEETCATCTVFYKHSDDRCVGYAEDDKCIKYTPVKYCFNCGAKMKGE